MGWQRGSGAAEDDSGAVRKRLQSTVTTVSRVRTDLPLVLLDALLVGVAYIAVLLLRFDGQVTAQYWSRFAALPADRTGRAPRLQLGVGALPPDVAPRQRGRGAPGAARRLGGAGRPRARLLRGRPQPRPALGRRDRARCSPCSSSARSGSSRACSPSASTPTSASPGCASPWSVPAKPVRRSCGRCCATPAAGFVPVAVLDDDPRKPGPQADGRAGRRRHRRPAAGVPRSSRSTRSLLAIPSAEHTVVRRVGAAAEAAGLPLRVLPAARPS